jgi:hypothetical protein
LVIVDFTEVHETNPPEAVAKMRRIKEGLIVGGNG